MPGDADAGVLVGGEHLLDVALGDDVAHRGAPVAGHHDAAGEGGRDDRRAVRDVDGQVGLPPAAPSGQQVGRVPGQEVDERRAAWRQEGFRQPAGGSKSSSGSLPTLLHEAADELLGVLLEHLVDLVEDRVDVVVELLLALAAASFGASSGSSSSVDERLVLCCCPPSFAMAHTSWQSPPPSNCTPPNRTLPCCDLRATPYTRARHSQ